MPRPVHFEIHAEDPARAQGFYAALFGWSFTRWGEQDYWLIKTGDDGPGIDGGLIRRMGPQPAPADPTPVIGYVCTIGVEDVDATVARATELGGSVAMPKMAVAGVGWLAYVKDTESNLIGLMDADPNAS